MLMEGQNYQTINLENLRMQMLHYRRELHSNLLRPSTSEMSELDMLVSLYQRLQTLHASMAKDLVELEIFLALSSNKTVLVEQTRTDRKLNEMNFSSLSCKEKEVLNMFAKGYSYSEAADLLNCKLTTIQTHAKRIYKKLKVHSRSEAVFEARQLGLVQV